MKAQPHTKTTSLKEVDFNSQVLKGNRKVITFDEGGGFDTHWEYSYIMDYISLHKRKKHKS